MSMPEAGSRADITRWSSAQSHVPGESVAPNLAARLFCPFSRQPAGAEAHRSPAAGAGPARPDPVQQSFVEILAHFGAGGSLRRDRSHSTSRELHLVDSPNAQQQVLDGMLNLTAVTWCRFAASLAAFTALAWLDFTLRCSSGASSGRPRKHWAALCRWSGLTHNRNTPQVDVSRCNANASALDFRKIDDVLRNRANVPRSSRRIAPLMSEYV